MARWHRSDVPLFLLLVPFGLVAGTLTTFTGLGGGILLLLTLSVALGPQAALAITAPALLVGNLHRLWLYRDRVDRGVATAFVLGAFPGAFLGGLVAVALPRLVLQGFLIATTLLAVANAAGWIVWRPSRRTASRILVPAGAGIGALSATGAGAGLLAVPILLTLGLSGPAYVATSAAGAAAMHIGRLLAYGIGGLVDGPRLAAAAVLAAGILGGNLLGDRLRDRVPRRLAGIIEHATLVLCVVVSLAGLTR
jgi:hypothetical protein